ncbi:hypothetical protein ACFXK0_23205 [Nocardia sp. NPDC059177]|uniref:hypothetical protein n=1 Tax=Nocardia sp. NPDC059177 TaxID=3346759 RepID=UPI00368BA2A4
MKDRACALRFLVTGWAPSSCTLPSSEVPLRIAEFDQLFATSVLSFARPGPTALELTLPRDAEAGARDLTARESGCCSFFAFDFRAGADVVLRIGVPAGQVDVLDAIEERVRRAVAERAGER